MPVNWARIVEILLVTLFLVAFIIFVLFFLCVFFSFYLFLWFFFTFFFVSVSTCIKQYAAKIKVINIHLNMTSIELMFHRPKPHNHCFLFFVFIHTYFISCQVFQSSQKFHHHSLRHNKALLFKSFVKLKVSLVP